MTISAPEYQTHEEFQNRSAKLEEIRALGIDPYPPKYRETSEAKNLHDKYEGELVGNSEEAAEGKSPQAAVMGRLVLFRAMGKNAFGQIQDHTERLQIMCNRDLTTVEGLPDGELKPLKFIEKKLDLGDIIGAYGHLFRTQKGELTLFVKKLTLLCKTLLPLPDKHAGLVNKGVRYRKRWLDLITHHEVVKTFRLRSQILREVRNTFHDAGFIEVETPVLQNLYGGAEARPFTTQINALNQEMYLRISLEIPLKKLIVGGMDRIFEIGKVFRNEGIDKTHNPEFTMLEAYGANLDYNDMMVLTENLFANAAQKILGTTKLQVPGNQEGEILEIDLKAPWKRISMKESIKEYGKLDVDALSDEEMRIRLIGTGEYEAPDLEKLPRGLLIAKLFEALVEQHLIQPHHIIDHPIETTPLCKLHRDPKLRQEKFVERFETFIAGREFCNSYSELNDPELQRSLLEEQAAKRDAGDEEASPLDEDFIEAICQGMPPTGGLGIGLDRMVMLFASVHSIRDVLFFPIVKGEE